MKQWEQQKGESAQAFEAFTVYLDMGESRSCHKVAKELTKSDTIIKRWSTRWNWQERIRAYNNEIQRQKLQRAKEDAEKMRDQQMETAIIMQQKAREALDKLDPEDLHPKYIIQMFQVAAKIEQEIRSAIQSETEQQTTESGSGDALLDALLEAFEKGKEQTKGFPN